MKYQKFYFKLELIKLFFDYKKKIETRQNYIEVLDICICFICAIDLRKFLI